jgi:hypothetical protein
MNREDYKLAMSAPQKRSVFTIRAMGNITAEQHRKTTLPWRKRHAAAFGFLAITAFILLGFTGYSYAIDSNPVELIRRVVSGSTVKVSYNSSDTFSYGKNRTYSDVAISAQAELWLLDLAKDSALRTLSKPERGIEYFMDFGATPNLTYISPRIAEIERVDDGHYRVRELYLRGNEYINSQVLDVETIIPSEELRYYKKLLPTELPLGKTALVAYYQQQSLKHEVGSGDNYSPITMKVAFQLNFPLKDYVEADKPMLSFSEDWKKGLLDSDLEANQILIDETMRDATTVCMNNGADTCPGVLLATNDGQSLYIQHFTAPDGRTVNKPRNNDSYENQEATFGSTFSDTSINNLLPRDIQGVVTDVQNDRYTIKTSSGATWTFIYGQDKQVVFAEYYQRPLSRGDKIQISILQPLSQVDSRIVESQYIINAARS